YTLSKYQYRQGGPNDYLMYADFKLNSIDAKEFIGLISKDFAQLRDDDRNLVPSRTFTLDINKEDLRARGIIPKRLDSLLVDQMQIKLLKSNLEKKDLAILDFLVTNNWERPIYLNQTSLSQINIDLSPYAVQEGNAYRILPVRNPRPDREFLVDTDKAFDNMINKFRYRELDNEKVYYSEDYRNFVLNHRSALNSLAEALIDEGQMEKANTVLEFSTTKMPDRVIAYDHTTATLVDLLFKVGQKEKALEIAKLLGDRAEEMALYLVEENYGLSQELRKNIFILNALQQTLYENGEMELGKKYEDAFNSLLTSLQMGSSGQPGQY
ncbi:MAG TPA: DUF2723 domain-containing protein, partial [Cyclobacteriaceae bacterium]|nr:DUF2723 domain-containing protein [Cyclobacteriaceae bacterium]